MSERKTGRIGRTPLPLPHEAVVPVFLKKREEQRVDPFGELLQAAVDGRVAGDSPFPLRALVPQEPDVSAELLVDVKDGADASRNQLRLVEPDSVALVVLPATERPIPKKIEGERG